MQPSMIYHGNRMEICCLQIGTMRQLLICFNLMNLKKSTQVLKKINRKVIEVLYIMYIRIKLETHAMILCFYLYQIFTQRFLFSESTRLAACVNDVTPWVNIKKKRDQSFISEAIKSRHCKLSTLTQIEIGLTLLLRRKPHLGKTIR